jgi:hypothetical protein
MGTAQSISGTNRTNPQYASEAAEARIGPAFIMAPENLPLNGVIKTSEVHDACHPFDQ